jgi:glycosyltransferase involved in cell wall biosynthesis
MIIGIDGNFVTRLPRRGIGTYSLNFIISIVNEFPDDFFIVYLRHPDNENLFPKADNLKIRRLWGLNDIFWEQVMLPLAAFKDKIDILHSLGNTSPLIMFSKTRRVLSVMDVIFLKSGGLVPKPTSLYQQVGRIYRSIVFPLCSKFVDAIITISDFSKSDIKSVISNLEDEKVNVIYLACDPVFKNPCSDNISLSIIEASKDGYFLALGAEDPRKNTLRLVRVFLDLIKNNHINSKLLICGYKRYEMSEAYRLVRNSGLDSYIVFLPFVSNKDLSYLYSHAIAFIYPSLYEGFGIPLVEAFYSGCPVVASSTTSIPEVCGHAAIYFEPNDDSSITAAIMRIFSDEKLRKEIISKGFHRALKYSWELNAIQTYQIYRRVV